MLIGTFLFTGCSKFSFGTFDESKEGANTKATIVPENNKNTDTEIGATESPDEPTEAPGTEDAAVSEDDVTPTPVPIQPIPNIELPVYTVNADGDIEPVTALIPEGSEITARLIVDTVVEALADQNINVGIDDVTLDGDKVIVSFKKGTPPSQGLGSAYEGAILDAFAQSLIDNLQHCKVIYRLEGGAYLGGAYEFGIDEVYLGDN
jgi:hypothetical protein